MGLDFNKNYSEYHFTPPTIEQRLSNIESELRRVFYLIESLSKEISKLLDNSQQHQELNRNVKSKSCGVGNDELGSKETGDLTSSGVEDHLPNSSHSPADTNIQKGCGKEIWKWHGKKCHLTCGTPNPFESRKSFPYFLCPSCQKKSKLTNIKIQGDKTGK